MGRLLIIDGLLTFWVTLSLLAAFEAIRGARGAGAGSGVRRVPIYRTPRPISAP